jgi:hypothetical protein
MRVSMQFGLNARAHAVYDPQPNNKLQGAQHKCTQTFTNVHIQLLGASLATPRKAGTGLPATRRAAAGAVVAAVVTAGDREAGTTSEAVDDDATLAFERAESFAVVVGTRWEPVIRPFVNSSSACIMSNRVHGARGMRTES